MVVRKSIQMFARSIIPYEELQRISNEALKETMNQKYGFNWDDCAPTQKYGSSIVKKTQNINGKMRMCWQVEEKTPVFMRSREYINDYVY